MVRYVADRRKDIFSITGGPPITLTAFSNKCFFAIKMLKYALQVMVRYAADRRNDLVSIFGGPPMTATEFSKKFFFAIKNLYAADRRKGIVSIVRGPPITLTAFSNNYYFCNHNFEVRAAGNGTICDGQTQLPSQHRRRPPRTLTGFSKK